MSMFYCMIRGTSSWQSEPVEAIGHRARERASVGRLCLAFGFVLFLGAAGCARHALPPSAPSPLLEQSLPEFEQRALDGRKIESTRFAGRPVVIKFFAEYCEPCQRTLPATQRLHEKYPGVLFLGVSEDDRQATAERTVERHSLTFQVLLDAGKELSALLHVSQLPATLVVDRDGIVRFVAGPQHSERDVAEAVRSVAE